MRFFLSFVLLIVLTFFDTALSALIVTDNADTNTPGTLRELLSVVLPGETIQFGSLCLFLCLLCPSKEQKKKNH